MGPPVRLCKPFDTIPSNPSLQGCREYGGAVLVGVLVEHVCGRLARHLRLAIVHRRRPQPSPSNCRGPSAGTVATHSHADGAAGRLIELSHTRPEPFAFVGRVG